MYCNMCYAMQSIIHFMGYSQAMDNFHCPVTGLHSKTTQTWSERLAVDDDAGETCSLPNDNRKHRNRVKCTLNLNLTKLKVVPLHQ